MWSLSAGFEAGGTSRGTLVGAANAASSTEFLGERVLGNPDAKVVIIEYSSLTCPHCAAFHKDTLPAIKKTYLDTGKAKLVFRDFPFDQLGLVAAVTARCVKPTSFFPFVDMLFKSQAKWSSDPNPVGAIARLARLAGLSPAAFDACLKDQELVDTVLKRRVAADKTFGVNSTPTFFINGTRVEGAQPFAEFKKVIDAELAK